MDTMLERRALLAGLSGLPLLAAATARVGDYPVLSNIELDEDAMLDFYLKLRHSLDDRVTIGWVDAVNYAHSGGETFPLYRLLAATWRRTFRTESGPRTTVAIEIAFFLDMQTGQLLERLRMPITGKTVDVPLYRSGPSTTDVVARSDRTREFSMRQETREGESFFTTGRSISQSFLSQPQRRGDDFYLREDLSTRVYSAENSPPAFFYREWTVTRGSWSALQDPTRSMVPIDLAYSATTAWRPWMQMDGVPGHTVQNGLGSRTDRFDELPADLQGLAGRHHPDLVEDPAAALAPKG